MMCNAQSMGSGGKKENSSFELSPSSFLGVTSSEELSLHFPLKLKSAMTFMEHS